MKAGNFTEQDVLELARKGYAQGNPEFDIIADKCALLVIDMQDEFVSSDTILFFKNAASVFLIFLFIPLA